VLGYPRRHRRVDWDCDVHRNFEDVKHDRPLEPKPVQQNLFYRYKWLRESLRIAKLYVPFLSRVPALFELSSKIRSVLKGGGGQNEGKCSCSTYHLQAP
jgi:hypothetical protein